ncbi:hypothetical protein C0J52_01247 [Blattella germanica]|nr:hypothetical protein C0J52_01247 [Blattella germanica]
MNKMPCTRLSLLQRRKITGWFEMVLLLTAQKLDEVFPNRWIGLGPRDLLTNSLRLFPMGIH